MPILLDTNVYLLAMRSEDGAAFFERRFLPLVFQTYIAGVVVEELYAGALDSQVSAWSRDTLDHLNGPIA